jgi:hypothetical protein
MNNMCFTVQSSPCVLWFKNIDIFKVFLVHFLLSRYKHVWEREANRVPLIFDFFCLKWIFFYIFRSFWCADIKNNFFKIKKLHFNAFLSTNHFEPPPLPQSQTHLPPIRFQSVSELVSYHKFVSSINLKSLMKIDLLNKFAKLPTWSNL